ncbi:MULTISPECIES: hypothetical protein [unclassified Methylophaga]|jgi:hypothetical protein|uniref:hypothetical protein n=1 Tax=unclassified Methylophaga TaxID=2629249 RepID=UPI0026CCF23F|tara:strand:- start:10551 stop:10808 length:258 start_codon:yes stop_codon:yes gene_type:complete
MPDFPDSKGVNYKLQMLGFLSSNGTSNELLQNVNNQNFATSSLLGFFTPIRSAIASSNMVIWIWNSRIYSDAPADKTKGIIIIQL